MRIVKLGIIGCGVISHTYISNIQTMFANIQIIACASRTIEKAQIVAEKYHIPIACSTEELLRNTEVELILNLTTPDIHTDMNRMILNAGKHLYCEKPFALDLDSAKEILDLAKEKGLAVGGAPETFLGAGIQTCKKALDEGWIGKPITFTANMTSYGTETWHSSPEFYYQQGAGPMLDMGPYYITALVSLFGSVAKTACFASIARDKRMIYSQPHRGQMIEVEVPTSYTGIMEFESGVHGNINMSFDVWNSTLPKLEIYGTDGTLILPDPNMFGGKIKVFRKERILDQLSHQFYGGSSVKMDEMEGWSEIPQLFEEPLEYMRGLAVAEMADAIVSGRQHRTSEELLYHVTEVLLSFDQGNKESKIQEIKSRCSRPTSMPSGKNFGCFD